MSPCKLIKNFEDSFVIVTITGSLVYEDVINVSEEINKLFTDGWQKVIIDMSQITHVNSKGIGALISIQANSAKGNGKFVLLNPSDELMKILIVTKLVGVFNIQVGSIEEVKSKFS